MGLYEYFTQGRCICKLYVNLEWQSFKIQVNWTIWYMISLYEHDFKIDSFKQSKLMIKKDLFLVD